MRCNFTVDRKSRCESGEVTARGQSSNFLVRLVTVGRQYLTVSCVISIVSHRVSTADGTNALVKQGLRISYQALPPFSGCDLLSRRTIRVFSLPLVPEFFRNRAITACLFSVARFRIGYARQIRRILNSQNCCRRSGLFSSRSNGGTFVFL